MYGCEVVVSVDGCCECIYLHAMLFVGVVVLTTNVDDAGGCMDIGNGLYTAVTLAMYCC
jgi:hypothetical protein